MIQLGLTRIYRLLQHTSISWPAIHVAGTNGKGSVCAYASAMLKANHIKVGRFTSPHLVDRWDCITIDEKTVDEQIFHEVELSVKTINQLCNIKATEFELLTAIAFKIFCQEQVEIGVVEVGLGGKFDATNILSNPLVTVITKIGMDHQTFLGDTIEEIASQKAGIMKKNVPCVVDATNLPTVLDVFKEHAQRNEAGPTIPVCAGFDEADHEVWKVLPKETFEPHQQTNICLAFNAVKLALRESRYPHPVFQQLLHAIPKVNLPGRLQKLSIEVLTGRKQSILLDGAHNLQSSEVLSKYVNEKLRQRGYPVTWLLAFSKGKDVQKMLASLVRPEDNLLATTFGPVDGMPWVQPTDLSQILHDAKILGIANQKGVSGDLLEGLRRASDLSTGGPLVIAGSLYLVSDVLRLLSSRS